MNRILTTASTLIVVLAIAGCTPDPAPAPTPVEGAGLGDVPRSIAQSIAEGENAPERRFEVRNTGNCPLDYSIAINGAPWVTVTPTMGRVAAATPETPNPVPATITATFATSTLPRGVHSGAIVITAFCQRGAALVPAMGSPLTIEISVTVRPYVAVLSSDTSVVSVDGATITAGSRWRTLHAAGAPAPTGQWGKPFACWTGTEMLFVYTPDPAVTPSRFVGALFDPLRGTWRAMPEMNPGGTPGRTYVAHACGPDHFFVASAVRTGADDVGFIGGMYHFRTGVWQGLTAFPTSTCGNDFGPARATWHAGRFAVLGVSSKVAFYDPLANTWVCKTLGLGSAEIPQRLAADLFVSAGGKLLVLGGSQLTGGFSSTPLNDGLICDAESLTPERLPCAPASTDYGLTGFRLAGAQAVWTGARLVVNNGANLDTGRAHATMLDPFRNVWTPLPEAITPRADTSLVWNGHQIIAFGGAVVTGLFQTGPTNTGWAMQRANGEVVILPTVGAPSARTRPLSVWTGEELLVWGGRPGTTDVTPDWSGGPVYALTP